MTYRRTKKYSAERQRAAQATREANRMAGPAPDYPAPLPELRMRITVERFDTGTAEVHVFTLKRSRRVDQYRVEVDGKPWRVAGLSVVLENMRKATPRRLSDRAIP
jgi:hypothetical protein